MEENFDVIADEFQDIEEQCAKRKRESAATWERKATFKNAAELEAWMAKNGMDWRIDRNLDNKIEYVCAHSAKRTRGKCDCRARMKVIRRESNTAINLETTGEHSNHEPAEEKTLSTPIKRRIDELRGDFKPAMIKRKLVEDFDGGASPDANQVRNYVYRAKVKNSENKLPTVEDLRRYADKHSEVPDEAYVCDFKAKKEGDEDQFCLTWTTAKLFGLQDQSDVLQVDSPYKLNWHGYLVMVAGFSDANRKFFPTHIALASNENAWCYEQFFRATACEPSFVLADADKAITAAAKSVWPNAERGTCWYHVTKNVKERTKPKTHQKYESQIFDDLNVLQQSVSKEEFKRASELLRIHWESLHSEDEVGLALCNYILEHWIEGEHNGWYEGFNDTAPSTNNGLKCQNRQIKDMDTLREKLPLTKFMDVASKDVSAWSSDPDNQVPAAVPKILPHLFQEAYELKKEGRPIRKNDKLQLYLVATKDTPRENLSPFYVELVTRKFADFNRFKELKEAFYVVKPSNIWPRFFSCICTDGIKKRPCKYVTRIMKLRKLVVYPPDAVSEPLEQKRKSGRPRKAAPALQRE